MYIACRMSHVAVTDICASCQAQEAPKHFDAFDTGYGSRACAPTRTRTHACTHARTRARTHAHTRRSAPAASAAPLPMPPPPRGESLRPLRRHSRKGGGVSLVRAGQTEATDDGGTAVVDDEASSLSSWREDRDTVHRLLAAWHKERAATSAEVDRGRPTEHASGRSGSTVRAWRMENAIVSQPSEVHLAFRTSIRGGRSEVAIGGGGAAIADGSAIGDGDNCGGIGRHQLQPSGAALARDCFLTSLG